MFAKYAKFNSQGHPLYITSTLLISMISVKVGDYENVWSLPGVGSKVSGKIVVFCLNRQKAGKPTRIVDLEKFLKIKHATIQEHLMKLDKKYKRSSSIIESTTRGRERHIRVDFDRFMELLFMAIEDYFEFTFFELYEKGYQKRRVKSEIKRVRSAIEKLKKDHVFREMILSYLSNNFMITYVKSQSEFSLGDLLDDTISGIYSMHVSKRLRSSNRITYNNIKILQPFIHPFVASKEFFEEFLMD